MVALAAKKTWLRLRPRSLGTEAWLGKLPLGPSRTCSARCQNVHSWMEGCAGGDEYSSLDIAGNEVVTKKQFT